MIDAGLAIALGATALSAVALIGCSWMSINNDRTFQERMALLNRTRGRPWQEWLELMKDQERVSYDQHLYARMRFKNPWKLYSQRVQELMHNDYRGD